MNQLPEDFLRPLDLQTLGNLALTNKELKPYVDRELSNRINIISNALANGDIETLDNLFEREGQTLIRLIQYKNLYLYITEDKFPYVIDWLLSNKLKITYDFLFQACIQGRLDILKWENELFKANQKAKYKTYTRESEDKLAETRMRYNINTERNTLIDSYFILAIRYGQLNILEWLFDNNRNYSPESGEFLLEAVESNRLDSFLWLINRAAKKSSRKVLISSESIIAMDKQGWDPEILNNFATNIDSSDIDKLSLNYLLYFANHKVNIGNVITKIIKLNPSYIDFYINKFQEYEWGLRDAANYIIEYAINNNRGDLLVPINQKYFDVDNINEGLRSPYPEIQHFINQKLLIFTENDIVNLMFYIPDNQPLANVMINYALVHGNTNIMMRLAKQYFTPEIRNKILSSGNSQLIRILNSK